MWGLFILTVLVSAARAQPDPVDMATVEILQRTLAAVADEVRPSVVAIRADRQIDVPDRVDGRTILPDDEIHERLRRRLSPAVGSGVVLSADGLILTNEHVIHNARPDTIEIVLSNGERYTAQGITSDPRSDLAVLRIDAAGLKPARLGDLGELRQGYFALVLGNPFGAASESNGQPAMSFGVISALGQDLTEKLDPDRYYGNLIQTDARISPGNSGGPLIDLRGKVVGIVTAIWSRAGDSEDVGYAIAIDRRTRAIIERLAQGELVEYGYLGVGLRPPRAEDRSRAGYTGDGGAVVDEVRPDTPAAYAGLHSGDLIVEFDDQRITGVDKLIRVVGAARVDIPVRLSLYRDGRKISMEVSPVQRAEKTSGVNIEVPFEWRGMRVENSTPEVTSRFDLAETTRGIVITRVEPGSVAERAGLQAGQVIQQIQGQQVRGVRRLRTIVRELDESVTLVIDADPPVTIHLSSS
jgi:serine protease Do